MSYLKYASLLAFCLACLMACGGGSDPTTPTTTPTPTPIPTPTPEPTPEPTPYVAPHPNELDCIRREDGEPSTMNQIVKDAQKRLEEEAGERLFDWDSEPGYIIFKKSKDQYIRRIIENIRDIQGYDAWPGYYEPDSHIAVKRLSDNNKFSEAFFVISSDRKIQTTHAYTCYPAEFSDGLDF
jgi:hypothetical protein